MGSVFSTSSLFFFIYLRFGFQVYLYDPYFISRSLEPQPFHNSLKRREPHRTRQSLIYLATRIAETTGFSLTDKTLLLFANRKLSNIYSEPHVFFLNLSRSFNCGTLSTTFYNTIKNRIPRSPMFHLSSGK